MSELERSLQPRVWVKSITFSDNSKAEFAANDIVVIVGPNNSGKSAMMRAVRDKCASPSTSNPVLTSVDFGREGSTEDLVEWLRQTTTSVLQYNSLMFQSLGHQVQQTSASSHWQNLDMGLNELAPFFSRLLSTEDRLQAASPPSNIAITRQAPTHPIHYFLKDDGLEAQLSRQFKKAFGLDIIVHRNAGSEVPLYVGEKPQFKPGQDRVSFEYIQDLEKLPTVHTQGDGMRSFLGVLLSTMVGHESILLIDEPEAFLHPPQARHLGSVLVSEGRDSQQLFLATHSGDVLRGVLDSENPRVRVLRIRRSETVNIARELKNPEIKSVWSDPLLRYSNILDGLFHERVVVCESDSDCRFYSAIMDSIFEANSENRRKPDIMFTHCGGKARLPLVIRSLHDLEVPISVVADFDILSDENPLRSIFEAAGGDWNSIEADWRQVKEAVDSKKPELSTDEVKRDIEGVLADISAPMFPPSSKKQIQSILRRSSPWSTAKSVGIHFIPNGQPSQACMRLLDALEKLGIFVVPVGELEGFDKSTGGHGPAWVAEVLRKDISNSVDIGPARQFVTKLISSSSS